MLQFLLVSNTLTIRLPKDLLDRVRNVARRTGLPVGRLVRESLETTLLKDKAQNDEQSWRKYAGLLKDGPRNLSSRKGYSRG